MKNYEFDYENYVGIETPHGNAFLHHEIIFGKNDFNFEKYGIQWQNGKLKFVGKVHPSYGIIYTPVQ